MKLLCCIYDLAIIDFIAETLLGKPAPLRQYIKPEPHYEGETFNVIVTSATDPHNFYIQEVSYTMYTCQVFVALRPMCIYVALHLRLFIVGNPLTEMFSFP